MSLVAIWYLNNYQNEKQSKANLRQLHLCFPCGYTWEGEGNQTIKTKNKLLEFNKIQF